tara:strand:- start:799 stop:1656 length:858 start_codon:yes stop_codon:yes gene_type:complete
MNNPKSLQITQALAWATAECCMHESAQLDAQVLLGYVLDKPRSYFYTWPERILSEEALQSYQKLIAQRKQGVPVAHLIGEREFWSLPFYVNSSTLIPRPATESLVEIVLNLPLPEQARLLDLGTGTGAIALSLAHERPKWRIQGLDQSEQAIALARKNKQRLKLEQVMLYQSSWFDQVTEQGFDCIVSNPPYIDQDDVHLQQGDVRFEPRSALVAADQGLSDLQHIVWQSRKYLLSQGYLVLEHGYQQGKAVQSLMEQAGFSEIKTLCDAEGHSRVTFGVLAEKL